MLMMFSVNILFERLRSKDKLCDLSLKDHLNFQNFAMIRYDVQSAS